METDSTSRDNIFFSFEPLLEKIEFFVNPDWVIIGAETGNRKGKIVPERWWIEGAIAQAREAHVPVFVKSNLVEIYPEFADIREFPA